tara:strand:- start:1728 stop:2399 length:672 start_codon:yes stop_codon:yes gene_type:complete
MTQFLRPFGPTVGHFKLDKEEIELLQTVAEQTKKHRQNVGKTLVGNIKDQLGCYMKTHTQTQQFLDILRPRLLEYVETEFDRQNELYLEPIERLNFDQDKFGFDLGTGPWINFQTANEFNPVHSHDGLMSAVIYIDVPEEMAKEVYTEDTKAQCPGHIEFMYGPDVLGANGTHTIVPETGDFLLFPSGLKHTVYPFKGDYTRISMSFNVRNYSCDNMTVSRIN